MHTWHALLQLQVSHGYYADGRCRGLRFEPCTDTAAALRRAEILMRSDATSLHLHGTPTAIDELAEQDLPGAGLAWRLFATDAAFACGTDDRALRPGQLLWVAPTADDAPSDLRAEPLALDEPRLAELLTPQDRRLPPFGLLWLPLSALCVGSSLQAPLRLRWQIAARATVWKYCLFGDWPEPALAIVDLTGAAAFSAPVRDHMDDGTPMLAIRSHGRLPLAQRAPQRLQLRSRPEQDGRADKVLIRRLPTPAAQFLAREVIDGQTAVISEIHVHR